MAATDESIDIGQADDNKDSANNNNTDVTEDVDDEGDQNALSDSVANSERKNIDGDLAQKVNLRILFSSVF